MHKLVEQRQMSVRRACKLIKLSGSVLRYLHRRQMDHATMDRLRALAIAHPRWGMRKMHAKLRMEGMVINRKRTRRLYRRVPPPSACRDQPLDLGVQQRAAA